MPRPLHIGVNALCLIPNRVGSTEIYLSNLLSVLATIDHRNRYTVFTNRKVEFDICPDAENFHLVQKAGIHPFRFLWNQTVFPLQGLRQRLDVIFSVDFTAPVLSPVRRVTLVRNLQHKIFPSSFGQLELQTRKFAVWTAAKTSHRLVTVTEKLKENLVQIYEIPENRIRVIPHGVESVFYGLKRNNFYGEKLLAEAKIPDHPYLLAISTLSPHKNWERLLEAYGKLVANGLTEHLVIAGLQGKGTSWSRIRSRVKQNRLEQRVHLLGWLPRSVLVALFKYADALVLPSLAEDLSMTLIEAMAAELPVACSDIPSLRETACDAAIFFDPLSISGIADGISQIMRNTALRNQLVDQGKVRTQPLTWRATAEKTLAVLLETGRH